MRKPKRNNTLIALTALNVDLSLFTSEQLSLMTGLKRTAILNCVRRAGIVIAKADKRGKRVRLTADQRAANRAQSCKSYAQRYPDRMRAYSAAWRARNPGKVKAKRLKYEATPDYKITHCIRQSIRSSIKEGRSTPRTEQLLGCTIEKARAHIEAKFQPGMSWDNHGEWHIDHKRPISWFDLSSLEEVWASSHFTNLQPLWAFDNLSKSNRRED